MNYVTERLEVAKYSFELVKSVIVSIYLCQNAVSIPKEHPNFQVQLSEKLHVERLFLIIDYFSFLMKKVGLERLRLIICFN